MVFTSTFVYILDAARTSMRTYVRTCMLIMPDVARARELKFLAISARARAGPAGRARRGAGRPRARRGKFKYPGRRGFGNATSTEISYEPRRLARTASLAGCTGHERRRSTYLHTYIMAIAEVRAPPFVREISGPSLARQVPPSGELARERESKRARGQDTQRVEQRRDIS